MSSLGNSSWLVMHPDEANDTDEVLDNCHKNWSAGEVDARMTARVGVYAAHVRFLRIVKGRTFFCGGYSVSPGKIDLERRAGIRAHRPIAVAFVANLYRILGTPDFEGVGRSRLRLGRPRRRGLPLTV